MSKDGGGTRGLTRALILGIAVGPILQVGCSPYSTQQGKAEGAAAGWIEASGPREAAGPALAARLATPEELCARVIASRSVRDIEVLLGAFPEADCIPATLAAMPPATLSAVSPALIATIPSATWQQVPQQTAQHLRRAPAAIAQAPRPIGARSGPY
jgi:hypothetical protein